MKKLFVLLAALLIHLELSAQIARNFTLVSHLPWTEQIADVQAYVDSAGNEYALVGHYSGVSIVSLANPSTPVVLQTIPGVQSTWREIETRQEFAYITTEGAGGIRIIDLSSLPGPVTHRDTLMDGIITSHSLYIEGDYLYIHGANVDNGGVSIYDISDPWNPTRAGAFIDYYVHDAYYRGDTGYLGCIYDGLLVMVDFTDKSNPQTLGLVPTPNLFTHNTWLNDAGNICYTTDELPGSFITAYDITDPTNITEVDRICSSRGNCAVTPHNVKVLNDFLITSYYEDGVHLVDATRPHNLVEIGWYDTDTADFAGAWSSDPYLPSGNVIVGDMTTGFWVVRPEYKQGCWLEGIVTDSITGAPLANAHVTVNALSLEDWTVADGGYAMGTPDSGTYAVTVTRFGYISKTENVTLDNGLLSLVNFELVQDSTDDLSIEVVEAGNFQPIAGANVRILENNNQFENDYNTDGVGQVYEPALPLGNYSLYAGHWGFQTGFFPFANNGGGGQVTFELSQHYWDEFLFDFGWTVQGPPSLGGLWDRAVPVPSFFIGNPANPGQDANGDYGAFCYTTGNGSSNPNMDDVDSLAVTLTSPVMDLSGYGEPVARFRRYFLNMAHLSSSTPVDDTLFVKISNGITTVTARKIYGANLGFWSLDSVVISDHITLTNQVRVIFEVQDFGGDHIVEAAIDRFEVHDNNPNAVDFYPSDPVNHFILYPNPGENQIHIRLDESIPNSSQLSIHLCDLSGKTLRAFSFADAGVTNEITADVADLPAGLYFVSLRRGEEQLSVSKWIKSR